MVDRVSFPQLRVRTEFSFRQAYGQVAKVADALVETGAPSAAIVDGGTWGHVRWSKALKSRGIRPMFGTELIVPQEDGRRPVAWALAADTRDFYRFSTAARRDGADIEQLFVESPGLVRFAGAALRNPDAFDYIDLNPASPLQQRAALRLAEHTGKPLVLTSDNAYPRRSDYPAFMAIVGRERTTPQHILTLDEMRPQFRLLDDRAFAAAVANTVEAAERCASELPTAPLIHLDGDLRALALRGKEERLRLGHIAAWTGEYEARLQRELTLVAAKGFESYFIVVADLIAWAKKRMLVGPGRGSSAGSLVCYLLRITEIDPLKHDLLFERFIDINRSDLPDIDIDFADSKRDLVFDYLAEKYGHANVARIGNVNTLRARSVIAEVCKRFGIPDKARFDVLNVLIEYSSGDSRYGHALEDTMTQTEPGKRFVAAHPEAVVMYELENHAWHTGVHAAGVIVCNDPVSDYATVGKDGVVQADKPDTEQLNLLKIDALGLRTLGVIEDSNVVDADTLYGLTLDDPEVFTIFNDNRYSGIFQFEGQAQRRVAAEVNIDSFRKIDHVTALARPGPLGGGASQHYIARAAGREPVTYRHPSMEAYLSKTMGVVLYQEQVMRICFEMGRFSWEVVSEIRKAMSGRKGKEYFDRRGEEFVAGAATLGVPENEAREIWAEICTFGAWGMNASHTVSYGVISYWCAWMKRYHPLEYAAACLRSAKDDTQTMEILREMADEGVAYTPFDPELSDINWSVQRGKLVGGFMNLVGFGPAKAVAAVEARRLGTMDEKLRTRIAEAEVKFAELYPLATRYAAYYADPESQGCRAGSRIKRMNELPPDGDVLTLVQVVRKELRDENETVRLARRNGRRVDGQSLFLDIFVTDDTGVPCTLRIDRFRFERIGRRAAEVLQEGDALLVRGRRIPNFAMIKIERIRCLNRPEALDA